MIILKTISCNVLRGGLYSEDKVLIHIFLEILNRRRVEVAVESGCSEKHTHESNREDIYALLVDDYEVDDARLIETKNKPISIGDTDRPIYKYGFKWNGIENRREAGC